MHGTVMNWCPHVSIFYVTTNRSMISYAEHRYVDYRRSRCDASAGAGVDERVPYRLLYISGWSLEWCISDRVIPCITKRDVKVASNAK